MNFLRKKWHSTIRTRLAVLYASAFFVAGLALIGVMYFQLNQVVGRQMIVRGLMIEPPLQPPGGVVGARIDRAPGNDEADATEPAQPSTGRPRDVAERLLIQAETRLNTLRAEILKSILVVSVISLVSAGAIAAVIGYMLAGQALQPLRRITATARGIANHNLHQRIALQGPDDEIKDLADTLDNMLERLDRAFDSQQRFIANASHELRTPLAINRTLIEVAMMKETKPDSALSQLGATLLAVNQRHERLIDGLLMLASAEQELTDRQPIDLADVARHALQESTAMARAAGVEIRSELESAPCSGDPVLLERLVRNLTDNAIRYNHRPEGWIQVDTGLRNEGQVYLIVGNPGPQIPASEVPRLFEPFRRLQSTERLADNSNLGRRGAGLGLSIVRSIVLSHGGKVHAAARDDGGLVVSVVLPARNSVDE